MTTLYNVELPSFIWNIGYKKIGHIKNTLTKQEKQRGKNFHICKFYATTLRILNKKCQLLVT